MKRYLGLALVFGWFFAVQTSATTPGAKVTTVVGPFVDEQSCKAEYEDLTSMLDQFGVKYASKVCAYQQES